MSVNHSRADVFVPEEFLDSANVLARLQQMRGKSMPKSVAANMLYHPGRPGCFLDCALKNRFMYMMPSFFAGSRVLPPVLLREDPLPAPVFRRVGVFAIQGPWQMNTAPSIDQVFFV